jgi:hypothetical protein
MTGTIYILSKYFMPKQHEEAGSTQLFCVVHSINKTGFNNLPKGLKKL